MRSRPSLIVMLIAIAAALAIPSNASADATRITFVARSCPSYTAVMANIARNNLQQSMRDLGRNTTYRAGQAISPALEGPQHTKCVPITGWKFALGDGVGALDTGTFGRLTRVAHPSNRSIVTQASVALRDPSGNKTGASIAGATTISLSNPDYAQSLRRKLWVQGGLPGDPVLNASFPAQYGFAALRCAVDNVNGDNVEYVTFPSGTTHVFCYAYYVKPAPTSGTIVVRSAVHVIGDEKLDEVFPFSGNLSYVPGGRFSLPVTANVGSSMSFVRGATGAGDDPWQFAPRPVSGWQVRSTTCTSATGTSTTTSAASGSSSIRLGAGDVVSCTVTFERSADGQLIVAVRTRGGVGSFPVTVTPPATAVRSRTITTTSRDIAAAWETALTRIGTYRISQRLPITTTGTWTVESVTCNGTPMPTKSTISFTMQTSSGGALCTFTNSFAPTGRIKLKAVTMGGSGAVSWNIVGPTRNPQTIRASVKTTASGVAADVSSLALKQLATGEYVITQAGVVGAGLDWSLIDITCSGGVVPGTIPGGVVVRLSPTRPSITCTFTNLASTPISSPSDRDETIPTPELGAPGGGTGGAAAGPIASAPPVVRNASAQLPVGSVATGIARGQMPLPWRTWMSDSDLLQPAEPVPGKRQTRSGGRRMSLAASFQLRIPRLGIRGRLQDVELRSGKRLSVPADVRRIGMWDAGALPGGAGNTVLVGHVDGPAGPGVFHRLARARIGDEAVVTLPAGRPIRYRVISVKRYTKGQIPQRATFGRSATNRLQLVTCGGRFHEATGHWDSNVVVTAVPVE